MICFGQEQRVKNFKKSIRTAKILNQGGEEAEKHLGENTFRLPLVPGTELLTLIIS